MVLVLQVKSFSHRMPAALPGLAARPNLCRLVYGPIRPAKKPAALRSSNKHFLAIARQTVFYQQILLRYYGPSRLRRPRARQRERDFAGGLGGSAECRESVRGILY